MLSLLLSIIIIVFLFIMRHIKGPRKHSAYKSAIRVYQTDKSLLVYSMMVTNAILGDFIATSFTVLANID